jgi:hypothetical protein
VQQDLPQESRCALFFQRDAIFQQRHADFP